MDIKSVIEIKKSDVTTFLKLCDGLSKTTFGEHARCCLIRSTSPSEVELFYYNNPNVVRVVCENNTTTMVQGFIVKLNVLRELSSVCDSAYMSFVSNNGKPYISLSGREIYIETEDLGMECYTAVFPECTETLDMTMYSSVRKASPLTLKSPTSYQNLIIKDGDAYFNTSLFIYKSKSPFSGSDNMLIPRPLVTTLNTMCDCGMKEVGYALSDRCITLVCDNVTIVCQICVGDKVNEYVTDTVSYLVGFDANLEVEDRLTNLLSAIGTLSYMDDIIEITSESGMLKVSINNVSHTSHETYPFPVSGANSPCMVKIPSSMLLSLMRMNEGDVPFKLSVTEQGVGICGNDFKALLRRVIY